MFRRVLFDDWQANLAVVLFIATALTFVLYLIGSWRMKAGTADRLAHLPLEEDASSTPNALPIHERRA